MKVTAFVKYDLYPYYTVVLGDLQENFDVKTASGIYSREKVIHVRPSHEIDGHRNTLISIKKDHDLLLRKLKVDLLKKNGIHFINTDNF